MGCTEDLARVDAALASRAREEVALRLRLGQLLEVMGRGAVFDLGFSSVGAYALERCERGARWVEGARCVARRLEALPQLRRAMALGNVSWTVGELLASVATPADESRWLERAASRTVRQMRAQVAEALAASQKQPGANVDVAAATLVNGCVAYIPGVEAGRPLDETAGSSADRAFIA